MAAIDYPSKLPGVLVNSNGFSFKRVTVRNDLRAGAPIFERRDDDAYVLFNVAWSLDGLEVQVFQNFYKYTLERGSKLFNIELYIDGFNGIKRTQTHECFFEAEPQYQQNQKRWSVSARLIAITDALLGEAEGPSLVAAFEAFEDLNAALVSINGIIVQLEDTWLP